MSTLLACTRMYNATEAVAGLWMRFVQEVAALARVALVFERYAFPLDIEALWKRPDLGLAFICGRAFALYGQRHVPLAVPVNSLSGAPLYHTKLLVRAESPFVRLEDSFGSRLGWTVEHSQSGYHAVREVLAPHRRQDGRLLHTPVGPLHTPANCLRALGEGAADIVPVDSYYYDLLARNAPEKLAGTRVLSVTADRPMPFLAASPGVDPHACNSVRQAVREVSSIQEMKPVLDLLCIEDFTDVDTQQYSIFK